MFSKTKGETDPGRQARRPDAAAPPPSRRTGPKAISLLAGDILFEGDISGDGELMIDGAIKGDVHVARLVVGEHARVEGSLTAESIDVRGRVQGDIHGAAVRLFESAHVEGDITHQKLSIEAGAFFQGRCQQMEAPAEVSRTPVLSGPTSLADAGSAANVIDLDQVAQR
jgi:cytoskeletal protein CcmA (bactofilin family)